MVCWIICWSQCSDCTRWDLLIKSCFEFDSFLGWHYLFRTQDSFGVSADFWASLPGQGCWAHWCLATAIADSKQQSISSQAWDATLGYSAPASPCGLRQWIYLPSGCPLDTWNYSIRSLSSPGICLLFCCHLHHWYLRISKVTSLKSATQLTFAQVRAFASTNASSWSIWYSCDPRSPWGLPLVVC